MNWSRKGLRAGKTGISAEVSRKEAEKCQFILALFTSGMPRDAGE